MKTVEIIKSLKNKKKHPDFRVGDSVRVHVKIKEAEKERVQVFEGTVIKKRGSGKSASFTVRKLSYGTGVERIFPSESAVIDKIEMLQHGKVRRARLFYLRNKQGKASQIQDTGEATNHTPDATDVAPEATPGAKVRAGAESQSATAAT